MAVVLYRTQAYLQESDLNKMKTQYMTTEIVLAAETVSRNGKWHSQSNTCRPVARNLCYRTTACSKALPVPVPNCCHVMTHFCARAGVWLRTGRPGFDARQGQRIFPLASESWRALGPTQPPVRWVPRVLSPGVKRGRGVMLTTPSPRRTSLHGVMIVADPCLLTLHPSFLHSVNRFPATHYEIHGSDSHLFLSVSAVIARFSHYSLFLCVLEWLRLTNIPRYISFTDCCEFWHVLFWKTCFML
jgi:hypothetical protein